MGKSWLKAKKVTHGVHKPCGKPITALQSEV